MAVYECLHSPTPSQNLVGSTMEWTLQVSEVVWSGPKIPMEIDTSALLMPHLWLFCGWSRLLHECYPSSHSGIASKWLNWFSKFYNHLVTSSIFHWYQKLYKTGSLGFSGRPIWNYIVTLDGFGQIIYQVLFAWFVSNSWPFWKFCVHCWQAIWRRGKRRRK